MDEIVKNDMLFVSEYFYSLQGEGANSGRAAFFIRLSGCKVFCEWCDSKNSWGVESGTQMSIEKICSEISNSGAKIAIITGGEPMLQNLELLCSEIRNIGVEVHLETSGSEPFSGKFDWITLSPKRLKTCREEYYEKASELKIVIESEKDFINAELMAKKVNENCIISLQAEWNRRAEILPKIIKYIKNNNNWRLSLQIHKFIGIE